MEFDSEFNKRLIKFLLLAATTPLWLPFIKILWNDLNDAVRADGGLFGDPPSKARREEIEKELARKEDPWVNEPLAHHRRGGGGSQAAQPGPSGGTGLTVRRG